MTEHVQTHDVSVYVTSGYGSELVYPTGDTPDEPDEPWTQHYVWAQATDGTADAYHIVVYKPEACDPFPEIKHHLRQRAIYEAIRRMLTESDPTP